MRTAPIVFLFVVAAQAAFAQSPFRFSNPAEPPEFAGPPKSWTPPTDTEKQLAEAVLVDDKDTEKLKVAREKLDEFIEQNPSNSDAHFIRATEDLCVLKSKDYDSLLKDVDASIVDFKMAQTTGNLYKDLADHYSMRARLKLLMGRYSDAMADLDSAIADTPDSAQSIFGASGVQPATESKPCEWSTPEFDALARRFPTDYRVHLYRGLYLTFFITFKEDYYQAAVQEFQNAIAINSKSSLPFYYLGELYTKSSFWSKAAWQSDAARDDAYRKAAQQYTLAIERNPKYLPAYVGRAEVYLELKQPQAAIKDYDVVLEQEPDNAAEHNDRGLAEMDLGRYGSAISDFGDALRVKEDDNSGISQTYENRADAYLREGQYAEAIDDLTKAIAHNIGPQSILINIKQFRVIYPEFDNVADDLISRKLYALFWPNLKYEDFAKMFLEQNKNWTPSFILADLYVKRGDAYIQNGQWHSAVSDYRRAFDGFGDYGKGIDRWRPLGKSGAAAWFVDAKTVELSPATNRKLWLKTVTKKSSYTVDAYELDCASRQIARTSTAEYDSKDNILHSLDASSGWQSIIPDSIGERLYDGACSR